MASFHFPCREEGPEGRHNSFLLQGGYCGLSGKNASKNIQGLQSPYYPSICSLKIGRDTKRGGRDICRHIKEGDRDAGCKTNPKEGRKTKRCSLQQNMPQHINCL